MKVIQKLIARIHALRSYYTMIVQTLYKRSVCFWVTMNWVYISSKNMVWNDKKQISWAIQKLICHQLIHQKFSK